MHCNSSDFLTNAPLFVGSIGGDFSSIGDRSEVFSRCDLVEIRWDLIDDVASEEQKAVDFLLNQTRPLLHTARVPAEGGKRIMPIAEVKNVASKMRAGDLWDVELATWLNDHERREAFLQGWGEIAPILVLSFHNFSVTPSLDELKKRRDQARDAKAHIFKVATHLETETDVDRLLQLQNEDAGIAIATMGMGQFGADSRIRCADAGSVLNYGYLGSQPTAPGQWEVGKLREAYLELKNSEVRRG